MATDNYNSDVQANALFQSLVSGLDFTIPNIDLTGDQFKLPDGSQLDTVVEPVTAVDVTSRTVGGTGIFDALMDGVRAQLTAELSKNTITKVEFTTLLANSIASAMQTAVQFALQKDQSFWQAQSAQIQGITALVGLETAKVQNASAQAEAYATEANYALTKLKLATEDSTNAVSQYQLDNTLPNQLKLIQEQIEVQRASTMDTRTDGTVIAGSVGMQKQLYTQQITSYKRSSEYQAVKLASDAWVTQKTMDEGLTPPNVFTNAGVQAAVYNLMSNNNIATSD